MGYRQPNSRSQQDFQQQEQPNPAIVQEYFNYLNDTNAATLQHNQRVYAEQSAKLRQLQVLQQSLEQQLSGQMNQQSVYNQQLNRRMNRNVAKESQADVKFQQLETLANAYNQHNLRRNPQAPYDALDSFESQIDSLFPKQRSFPINKSQGRIQQDQLIQQPQMQMPWGQQQAPRISMTGLAQSATNNLSASQLRNEMARNPNYGVMSYAERKDKYMHGKEMEFARSMAVSPQQFLEIQQLDAAREDVKEYQEKMSLERYMHDLEAKNMQLKQREYISHEFLTDPLIKNKSSVDRIVQQKNRRPIPFYLPFNPILNSQDVAQKYNVMRSENAILKEELGMQVGLDYVAKKLAMMKGQAYDREQLLQKIREQDELNQQLLLEREQLLARINFGPSPDNISEDVSDTKSRKKTKIGTVVSVKKKTVLSKGGRAKKIIKCYVTMMLFAKYYFLRIVKVKILEKRTKAMSEMISKMQASSNDLIEWMKESCKNGFEKLRTQKIELALKKGTKVFTGKERDKRIEEMKSIVKNILDGMLDNFSKEKIGQQTVKLLRDLTANGAHIPANFLFRFELNRLQFNSFGSTKNMNAHIANMLIICFVIVRLLIFKIVLVLWNHDISKEKTPLLLENTTLIGSIIHWLVVESMKIQCPVFNHNTVNIAPESKPTFRKEPLVAPERQVDQQFMNAYKKGDLEEYLILGIASKESLNFLFEEDPLWCQNIKAIVETLGEKFQEAIN